MTRAAVLGAGSWGTAFAKLLVDAGCTVTLCARRPELAATIRDTGANADYLPGIRLPQSLAVTADPAAALDGPDIVVLAVPSQTLRANLAQWSPMLGGNATVVSLMKGVELGTDKRMSEVICEAGSVRADRVAVVTGPNFAREIAAEQPTATVIACPDPDRATRLQHDCQTPYFRPYTNADMIGAELGGAVKNVMALACGMAVGMGFGDNTKASLITLGLAEMARLGAVLGAEPTTFAGLAGLGDLVATCMSPLSRNRAVGEGLGRGETMTEATAETHGQVAEGVKSCRSVLDLARRHDIDMPITEGVVAVCHEGMRPAEMVKRLMSREMRAE